MSFLKQINLPPHPYPISLVTSLALLIAAEANSFYPGSALFKIAASLSFFFGGLKQASVSGLPTIQITPWPIDWNIISGAEYHLFVILGLAFSVVGDVLLIPPKQNYFATGKKKPDTDEGGTFTFKAGTFFFALAHIAYIAAFLADPARTAFRTSDFLLAFTFGIGVGASLGLIGDFSFAQKLNVPEDMNALVKLYIIIITTMVGVATATDAGWQKIIGAWMFILSDMFVAVDVFGKKSVEVANGSRGRPGWRFRSVGWISYFFAQIVLAGCI